MKALRTSWCTTHRWQSTARKAALAKQNLQSNSRNDLLDRSIKQIFIRISFGSLFVSTPADFLVANFRAELAGAPLHVQNALTCAVRFEAATMPP